MEKSSDAAINQNAEISAISKDERVWALLCHISAFACFVFPFGNIIAPLIVWVLKKDESPFIDDQGKEALNFQITVTIFFFISIILIFVVVVIPLLIGLFFFNIIFTIIAALKANDGEKYRYPINMKFID